MKQVSPLEENRLKQRPKLPKILEDIQKISCLKGDATESISDKEEVQKIFPKTFGRPLITLKPGESGEKRQLKVGVVFSGGQASGGHNVIAGLFDALKALNKDSHLFGFLGGPSGIVENERKEMTDDLLKAYRNTGGFDLIGSGRTKIETDDQKKASLAACSDLDGLVIIGGDDSNTNAAVLAEYFLEEGSKCSVVGVPKTIDGDLNNEHIEVSFGFDTATKTYAEMIGNIERDALSAKKYYHFIRVMGRSASHIALECALKTRPNMTLLSEEVALKKETLQNIISSIADMIQKRADEKKNYGVVLIPEGIIEFIPEIKTLISELNQLLADGKNEEGLSGDSKRVFESLPSEIQQQLLIDRDPHGNVQVSKIETQSLVLSMVKEELKKRGDIKFNGVSHFFGYEGRACMPSCFDGNYCYSLGFVAALLIQNEMTGYMASVYDLDNPPEEWKIKGVPITMMMNMEKRHGKNKPVIRKALVDLDGKAFKAFEKDRMSWALEDHYQFPGPIQFFGGPEITDSKPLCFFSFS